MFPALADATVSIRYRDVAAATRIARNDRAAPAVIAVLSVVRDIVAAIADAAVVAVTVVVVSSDIEA